MGSHVIWIGIDPNLLLQGIDPARFFGDKSFLKFNLDPPAGKKRGRVKEETVGGSKKAGVLLQDQVESQGNHKSKDAEIPGQIMPRRRNVNDKSESKDPDVPTEETDNHDDKEMELCSQNGTVPQSKDPDMTSDKEAMDHCSQMAKMEKNRCPKCEQMFPGELKLRDHIETVHKVKISFQCKDCDKQYAWEKDLKQHTRYKHTGELRFGCEHCGKILRSNYDLERHVDAIHDLTVHKCGDCSEEFKSKEYLRSHEIQNHNENAEQCSKCLKKFVENRNYEQHVEQNNCEKKKSNENLLDKSIEKAVVNEENMTTEKVSTEREKIPEKRIIQCWFCQRVFTSKVALNRHTKQQICQKDLREKVEIRCTFEHCTKVYETKLGLERHIMFHNNDRPFHCEDCGKSFIQKVSLKEHLRSHTGEKPFKCGECPAAFGQQGALRNHLRKHAT